MIDGGNQQRTFLNPAEGVIIIKSNFLNCLTHHRDSHGFSFLSNNWLVYE